MPPDIVKDRPLAGNQTGGRDAKCADIITLSITRRSRRSPSIPALPAHIAARIVVDPVHGCWVGQGRLDKNGYARYSGRGLHRVVWELLIGPVPDGLVLDHVKARGCATNACCNPGHLEPVTRRVNTLRGCNPAAVNARKTRCDHDHPFDAANTYWRPDGHRDCRICVRRRSAEYKARLRAGDLARAA